MLVDYYDNDCYNGHICIYLNVITDIMSNRKVCLLPKPKRVLEQLGENIRLARLRRKLSESQVAERAGIARSTLALVEKGTETVRIGSYVQVLFVLGLEKDLMLVGEDDLFGRKLQDADLVVKQRAPKKNKK